MAKGYMGKVLRVDLTTKEVSTQEFSEEVRRKYIGGTGLGTKILYEETTADTDPLGPDNPLIFMTGPLTGTAALNSGRHEVITRSPLTGIFGQANSGGSWGVFLKRAGYDGIIFKGRSKEPVYLWINEGKVDFRDAAHLWGKDTFETDMLVKNETNPKAVIASIGQAGERLVRIAGIMNNGTDARAAGRCGVSAVMGSKNLKAIAVFGTMKPDVEDLEGLRASVQELAPDCKSNMAFFNEFGTAGVLAPGEAEGDVPIRNWKLGSWPEGAKKIDGAVMKSRIVTSNYNCYGCVMGCGKTVQVKSGPFATVETGGPEYETLGLFGASCLIDNLEAIAKANELCNRYGLDTISTAGVIAFAMELYEHQLITKEQTGGIALTWGNAQAMVDMVTKIGLREDIGWLLGEGSKRASEEIGGMALEFAVHCKGLELSAHDPRCKFSSALQYAVGETGGHHLSSFSYPFESGSSMGDLGYPETVERFESEGKAEFTAKFQFFMSMFDSLCGCKFAALAFGDKPVTVYTEWLNLITGWSFTKEDFLQAGERIITLKRMFNNRCGITRKDDILPPRMRSWRKPDGDAKGQIPNLPLMLSEYYAYVGWDETGIPLPSTLEKLCI